MGVNVWSVLVGRLGILTVLALLFSCGTDEPSTFDVKSVEPLVAEALMPSAPQLVDSAKCSAPIIDRLGPIACIASVADVEIPVLVHPPGVDGRIRVESSAMVVWADDVANQVEERLTADTGIDTQVSCSPAARVSRSGQEFTCRAIDPQGRNMPLVATLVNELGNFRIDWAGATSLSNKDED